MCLCVLQISLENDYLGPRRVEALKKEDSDWQKKAQEAVLNIQEFTVKYFEITARAQKGMLSSGPIMNLSICLID